MCKTEINFLIQNDDNPFSRCILEEIFHNFTVFISAGTKEDQLHQSLYHQLEQYGNGSKSMKSFVDLKNKDTINEHNFRFYHTWYLKIERRATF